jgi:hypothetical protein
VREGILLKLMHCQVAEHIVNFHIEITHDLPLNDATDSIVEPKLVLFRLMTRIDLPTADGKLENHMHGLACNSVW